MKKKTILSKKVLKAINNSTYSSDIKLNVDLLNQEKFYNYKIEEWYGAEFGIKGALRKKIIETLLKTYYEWKEELDHLNKDYYLAIWLYNPRMLKSEIVCAIDERISYYENESFLTSNKNSKIDVNEFGQLSNEMEKFTWKRKIDLDPVHEWEIDFPKEQYEIKKEYYKDQKFYKKLIKESFHVVEKDNEKIYFYPKGYIWIGQLT